MWWQLQSQAEQLRKSTSMRTYRLRGEEVVFPHGSYSRTHLSAHVASATSTTPALDDQNEVARNPDRYGNSLDQGSVRLKDWLMPRSAQYCYRGRGRVDKITCASWQVLIASAQRNNATVIGRAEGSQGPFGFMASSRCEHRMNTSVDPVDPIQFGSKVGLDPCCPGRAGTVISLRHNESITQSG